MGGIILERYRTRSRPDLAVRFPLILTCAKSTQFCESQHRALPSLRRRARGPELETPEGRVRARARLNESLDPRVFSGQHGWWQACPELNEPGYDPFSEDGANYNLVVGSAAFDPVSGSVPLRAYLCQVKRAE